MAGISDKAVGKLTNRYKFNGGNELQNQEFSDGSGLEVYDAIHRMYDPQIGRFHQIDALADVSNNYSPYNFASDNPILRNDPLGLEDTVYGKASVTVYSTPKRNKGGTWLGYPGYSKKEQDRDRGFQDVYYNRKVSGQPLNQQGDPTLYTSKLVDYKRWDLAEKQYRAMQSWAAGIILCVPALTATPALFGLSTDLWGAKAVVSLTSQGLIKGFKRIDIAGVAADAFTAPGLNAVISGTLNITPFSEQKFTFGWNKTSSEFLTDAGTGLVSGLAGDNSWKPISELLKNTSEKSFFYISTQLGISTGFQGAAKFISNEK